MLMGPPCLPCPLCPIDFMPTLSRSLTRMNKETDKYAGEYTGEDTDDGMDRFIARLDAAERVAGAAELRARSYELMGEAMVMQRSTIVDVGCGAGRAVAELGERGARVTGVDPDPRMLAVARERWPAADFRCAGAYDLPFADGTVHGYRADKVFHELAFPERALAEAGRVLVPGGRAVLLGQDWDSFVIDADDTDTFLTRAIVHARADLVAGPRAARRYRNLLLDAGFRDVTVEVHTMVLTDGTALSLLRGLVKAAREAGAIGREQAGAWIADQKARARADRLFVALPLFLAAASAPG